MAISQSISAIHCVTVIDTESGKIIPDQDILIRDDKIASIDHSSKTNDFSDGLDGSGLFAIPGLIDTHVHALGPLVEDLPGFLDLPWVIRQQRKNLTAFLKSGVTTIRDMTAPLKLIRRFRKQAADFKILSPRILFAGPMLTVEGGYPYFIPRVPSFLELITGPVRIDLKGINHARESVDRLAKSGVDCIKIGCQSAKYDDSRTAIPCIPAPWIDEIVNQAHKHNLPAAVHHVYRDDLLKLLDVTFDSLEHLTIDEPLQEEDVERLAQKRIPVSTTLMAYGILDHLERLEHLIEQQPDRFEPKPRRFLRRACKAIRDHSEVSRFIGRNVIDNSSRLMTHNLKLLLKAGIDISYGTDSGGAITPPGCPHWEFLQMSKAGMSNPEILRSATTVAARVINRDDLGKLKPGATADIVMLGENPLDSIEAFTKVTGVIRDGRLLCQA